MTQNIHLWEEINRLFSVVCQIDKTGRIVAASELMKKRCKLERDGEHNFFDIFTFKRPTGFASDYASAQQHLRKLLLGYSEELGFAIRGQLVDYSAHGGGGLFFLGVPWLWWMESNTDESGLTLSDFPVHDVQMDQLFFMTTQQGMVEDLQAVNDELKKAKAELERAYESRQSYFNQVSHEMRTPLSGIISALTLLSDQRLQGRAKELSNLAAISAERLLDVINYTLDTAALEAGGSLGEDKVFDLEVLIEETLALARPKALEKNLLLARGGEPRFDRAYRGKPQLLKQVLTNLLGNALKFTSDGTITLSAKIDASQADGFERIQFAVKDDGPGIPENAMAQLFEPFASGLSEETAQQQGTGLGLSIVKRFVEIQGGEVRVDSAPFEGATFIFSIPLEPVGRNELDGVRGSKVVGRNHRLKGHVLIIDDMHTNLMLNMGVLESLGLEVTGLTEGQAAIEAVRENPTAYDLILMDLDMPDVDGYDAAREIRCIEGAGGLPIVALSAHVGSSVTDPARDAGMDAFFAKPLVRSKLMDDLQAWLEVEPIETSEAPAQTDVSEEVSMDNTQSANIDAVSADKPHGLSSSASAAATHRESVVNTVFDAGRIEALANEVGAGVADKLVKKFLEESSHRWEQLRTAIVASDQSAVVRESHTLGSACLTFGINEAGARFREIEATASSDSRVTQADLQAIGAPLSIGIKRLEAALKQISSLPEPRG